MAAKKKPAAEPAKAEPKQPEPPKEEATDIDSRMARLLEDHRRMGARP